MQQVSALEAEISELEARLKGIEARLMAPAEGDDVMKMTDDYLRCKSLLDARVETWAELSEKIE